MQDAPDTVEASRAQRIERQNSRFRDRGGVFVPATHNALVDILLARGVNGESPEKRQERKRRAEEQPGPSKSARRRTLSGKTDDDRAGSEAEDPPSRLSAKGKGKGKAPARATKAKAPPKKRARAPRKTDTVIEDTGAADEELAEGSSRTKAASGTTKKRGTQAAAAAPDEKPAKSSTTRRTATTRTAKASDSMIVADDSDDKSVIKSTKTLGKRRAPVADGEGPPAQDKHAPPPKRARASNVAARSKPRTKTIQPQEPPSDDDVEEVPAKVTAPKARSRKNAPKALSADVPSIDDAGVRDATKAPRATSRAKGKKATDTPPDPPEDDAAQAKPAASRTNVAGKMGRGSVTVGDPIDRKSQRGRKHDPIARGAPAQTNAASRSAASRRAQPKKDVSSDDENEDEDLVPAAEVDEASDVPHRIPKVVSVEKAIPPGTKSVGRNPDDQKPSKAASSASRQESSIQEGKSAVSDKDGPSAHPPSVAPQKATKSRAKSRPPLEAAEEDSEPDAESSTRVNADAAAVQPTKQSTRDGQIHREQLPEDSEREDDGAAPPTRKQSKVLKDVGVAAPAKDVLADVQISKNARNRQPTVASTRSSVSNEKAEAHDTNSPAPKPLLYQKENHRRPPTKAKKYKPKPKVGTTPPVATHSFTDRFLDVQLAKTIYVSCSRSRSRQRRRSHRLSLIAWSQFSL
ncbi:hypothetical protein B0H21DRAFT_478105 [Amylocystis lapponica]|nr:hypothetical protein B0H21DRAFT_478105 [Amylocystis lapponica]